MSEKHLKSGKFYKYITCKLLCRRINLNYFFLGDALPEFGGKLRLFGMRFCPFVHRTVLVLNAKNLQYDIVFVNLFEKPEWIYNFSPKGNIKYNLHILTISTETL